MVGATASVKVAMVCAPAITVTVAVPAAKSLATSNPALGKVETAVITVPLGRVSEISTWPAGSVSAGLHDPALGGPAATVTGVPATLNVKFVPRVTPLPAILQICRKPVVGGGGIVFTKVAMVWPPGLTATVAVPAARSLLINNPAPGRVLTDAKVVPDGMVSVMVAGRAGTTSADAARSSGRGTCWNRNRSSRDAEREVGSCDDAAPRNFANLKRTLAGGGCVGIQRHGAVERVAAAAHARAGGQRNGCQRENVSGKLCARAESCGTADLEKHVAGGAATGDHRRIAGRGKSAAYKEDEDGIGISRSIKGESSRQLSRRVKTIDSGRQRQSTEVLARQVGGASFAG